MDRIDDNMVVIQLGREQGDPSVISINCLNQLDLLCDLARVLFVFNLHIVKGDFSKDGQWCLIIFWVTPKDQPFKSIKWAVLKKHLVSACPPMRSRSLIPLLSEPKPNKGLYILQTWSPDRLGLLNGCSFLVIDCSYTSKELLHENHRQELLCSSLKAMLGEGDVDCKVSAAGPDWGGLECSPLACHATLLSISSLDGKSRNLESDLVKPSRLTWLPQRTSITVDNSLSPAHTLLQISCKDRRGLVYDCMRALKDFQIQVAFGRLSFNSEGYADIDLFVLEADGRKITDKERRELLSGRLELAIMQPVNVLTQSRGPDTELLVAAPIELCGRGRPKVLCDTTSLLRKLSLGIFQADFGRCTISNWNWEIYRFLFTERPDFLSQNDALRRNISEQTEKALLR